MSETEFLAAYSADDFDRPSLAVDVALVTIVDRRLAVLVMERPDHPFKGTWQLPGGFVRMDESLDDAAGRVLREKTAIDGVFTEQLYTFGGVDRDPRTRVVSVGYYALAHPGELAGATGVLATLTIPWSGETGGSAELEHDGRPLEVAFDHAGIVGMVVQRLRGKLDYAPVGYELLPDEFTLLDLQVVHETILGAPQNKDSFRRRMLATGHIEPTGSRREGVGHRPAALYRRAGA